VIEAGLTPSEYALPMLDPQTGAIRRVTVAWDSALELRVVKTRPRACGYWLARGETEAVRRLRLLGVEVVQLELAGEMRGETYRETGRDAARRRAARACGCRPSRCCSTCPPAASSSRSSSRSPTWRSPCSSPSRRPATPPTA
jgi:hypothetical protein